MPDTPLNDAPSLELGQTAIGEAQAEAVKEGELPAEAMVEGALIAERYRLEKCLGEGGMGIVYRAQHLLMKKTVAIKVLHPEMTSNAEVVARFKREAQAAAHIEHPNVCQATDFGQTDAGAFFLVMEYLEGDTLESMIETFGRLTPMRVALIGQQLCAALTQAHEGGVVHRDLKPENIMLIEREGNPDFVKIMDFGIARMTIDDPENNQTPARLTKAGMVYGTPHYMSPEQVVGGEIDFRADLYSLGVVLFEMVTGRLPFESKSLAAIMGMHVTQRPPRASEVAPDADIPRALDDLIASMMEKSPEKRPQSAEEARQALVLAIEEIERPPLRFDGTSVRTAALPVIQRAEQLGRPVIDQSKRVGGVLRSRFLTLPLPARAILVGALASFVVLTMFLVWALPESTPEAVAERTATTLTEERAQFLEDEQVTSALALAAEGDLEALHELRGADPNNPHLAYKLALHHAEGERWSQALQFFGEAADLDERYVHDPHLKEYVFTLVEGRNATEANEAIGFILRHPSPLATTRLEGLAREGATRALRKRAFDALKEMGQIEKAEDWSRASMELRQASGCSEHRERIEAIVKIGDPRSLPALQAVSDLPRRGCGILKQQDCYACIRGPIKEAIEGLNNK